MKKTFAIILTLIFTTILVACNQTSGPYAKAELDKVEIFEDQIKFELNIIDPDLEIGDTMDIRITITKKDSETVLNEHRVTKEELKDSKLFYFNHLDADIKYTITVKSTINNEAVTLFVGDYETDSEKGKNEKDILTVEDFFTIKDNPAGVYHLKADLDFEGLESEISTNIIRTFNGEFYGNNHTIKNFAITSGTSYYGMFGTLGSGAVVKNLVLEAISLNISTSGSTRVAGLLFGRISHQSVVVDDIKILGGHLEIKLNSESTSHDVGLLGGRSIGKISNIFIDEETKLVINAERFSEPNIGGLIGSINDANASINNIEVLATIEFNLTQTATNGLREKQIITHIGGVVGRGWQLKATNIVAKTNIIVNDLNFHIEKNEATVNKTYQISFRVGGLFGELGSTKLTDALYAGNISFGEINFENENIVDGENTSKVKFTTMIEIGGLLGRFGSIHTNLENLLRTEGTITVAADADIVSEGILIGVPGRASGTTPFYNENNKFGYLGDITNTELVRIINSLTDLFNEDSFVYKTYNN